MTTLLHAHSWQNWMIYDEDVGLKEKPEDSRYI